MEWEILHQSHHDLLKIILLGFKNGPFVHGGDGGGVKAILHDTEGNRIISLKYAEFSLNFHCSR